MKVRVYGGGHIAHSIVAAISQVQDVTVVTRRPLQWKSRVDALQNGLLVAGKHNVVPTSIAYSCAEADVVFIALPQFAFEEAISAMEPIAHAGQTFCFVPAPSKSALYSERLIDKGADVVAFQRVPFIARTIEYGKSVSISSPRSELSLMVSSPKLEAEWDAKCRLWFGCGARYLSSFLVAAFSNSNPLLHPSRLVELFKDWNGSAYPHAPLFYADWTDESSRLYIEADREMESVMRRYPVVDIDKDYESVLDHYGVSGVSELTLKIRSIPAFKAIKSPMREVDGGWVPDLNSRYFTEDVPFGTKTIQDYARQVGIATPVIDFLVDSVNGIANKGGVTL